VLVVVDGVYSLTSLDGYERLVGSEVFQTVLGGRRIPARSTVAKYLVVSAESHALLHRALLRMVRAEGLDTFEELTVDSTAIAANTAWPTESALILGFLTRINRLLERYAKYTQVAYGSKLVERWLRELARLHRSINLPPSRPGSAAKRRKLYGRLLKAADKTWKKLKCLLAKRRPEIVSCRIRPTFRLRVERMLEQIEADFSEAARRRVLRAEKVDASVKAYSLCDPDAYMISKGQRDPVVGYKPQLGRSGNGFIICFELERGNPADSDRLEPMLAAHIDATGTRPAAVSTEDGYSSKESLDALCDAGVEVISFGGAKGRKVLGDELYELDASILLRSERSAVESLIFTFKHKFGMRRFSRRGVPDARIDLSAAVLAYNLWRIAFVRKEKRRKPDAPPIRAVA